MTRTPEEVFAHHVEALGAGDLDEIVADYTDDAVFITSRGVLRGKKVSGRDSPSCSVTYRTHPGH
jgi:ketosteroid isomerase-like protein